MTTLTGVLTRGWVLPNRRRPTALTLIAILVALVSLAPVAYLLLREGFSISLLRQQLASPSTVPLILNTLELTGGVVALCLVLGVSLALLVARTNLPGRRVWTVLFTLPLGVPTFVASYTWVGASLEYAPHSRLIFSYGGAVIIMSLALFPYVFLPVIAALRGVDPAQEEAARSLGHGPASVFLKVTLPQLRTAMAGGALIIALHTFAEFGALQLLNYHTLTTAIVQRVTIFSAPEAARALSVVLAVGSVLLLFGEWGLRGRRIATRAGGGVARATVLWRLGRGTPLWLLGSVVVAVLALGVPIYVSITGLSRALGGHGAGVDWSSLGTAALNTTELAVFAAIAGTIVGLPISYLVARYPGRVSNLAERAIWIAHSLPGVILALALVFLGVRWLHPLYQTSTMLVIAYVILFLPLAVGAQRVGLEQASRQYDDVARSLGRGSIRTFARVTLPLALPGVAVGALLVLLDVEKELTTTLLLHPTGMDTLTTALWATTNGDVLDFTTAAPYGIALILIAVIPAYLLARRALEHVRAG